MLTLEPWRLNLKQRTHPVGVKAPPGFIETYPRKMEAPPRATICRQYVGLPGVMEAHPTDMRGFPCTQSSPLINGRVPCSYVYVESYSSEDVDTLPGAVKGQQGAG